MGATTSSKRSKRRNRRRGRRGKAHPAGRPPPDFGQFETEIEDVLKTKCESCQSHKHVGYNDGIFKAEAYELIDKYIQRCLESYELNSKAEAEIRSEAANKKCIACR